MKMLADETYQTHILQGVSRTFALTIPQLPPALCKLVTNAYLLCRIADTIEDERTLDAPEKRRFAEQFVDVVAGRSPAEAFAAALDPLLSSNTIEAERNLIRNSATVIRVTHSFTPGQRAVLERCVTIMGEGMAWFQANQSPAGLRDLSHLNAYCYYVAGVVGEMLTELFCDYSEHIALNRSQLLALAVSFGQGLQMTNILKDIWEDRSRGACWLPQDVFTESGFDLKALSQDHDDAAFARGLHKLIAIAHSHLRSALAYTLLLPRSEPGLRRFCLWAIGMALFTLRKINRNPGFTSGKQVKITRRAVSGVVLVANALVRRDRALEWLFDLVASPLPAATAPTTAQLDVSKLGPHAGRLVLTTRSVGATGSSSDWVVHE
jgi:farnesyl-diphosphate farnesyltransferase